MNNEFDIEPISVKKNVIVRHRDRNAVNDVLENSGIVDISQKLYADAFNYVRETGKAVVVQGAKIQITIAETGRFRKHKEIQVAYEMPSIRL